MAEIQAKSEGKNVVDKVVDTVKNAIDKFFNFLGNLDDSSKRKNKIKVKKTSKVNDKTDRIEYEDAHNKIPMICERTYKSETDDYYVLKYEYWVDGFDKNKVTFDGVKIYKNDEDKNMTTGDDMAVTALSKLATDEVRSKFGVTDKDLEYAGVFSSRTLTVRLHKVMGAKEDSIMLTGIKANFNDPYTATLILDNILNDDAFVDQLTDEPVSFEIVDTDDDYEISSIDQAQIDFMNEGFKTILCAAIKFNMDMQILHWQTYNDDKLFNITNDMLWQSQEAVNQFGMWVIEFDNEVTSAMISESCLSSFTAIETYTGSIGAEIKSAISEFVDVLNFEWPNFPHDIQNELDYRIRRMNETIDLSLRDY